MQNDLCICPCGFCCGLSRWGRTAFAAVLGVAGAALTASAAPVAVDADQNPAVDSFFTLNFAGFGGPASAEITTTNMTLEVDTIEGAARFVGYQQNVGALTLPGGFSTGAIHVEIVPDSSVGTFDSATGEFTTTEYYAVHFEGDLSAFGLTSPVILPSTSTGSVSVTALEGGDVVLDWSGEGVLPNPFDPQGEPLTFNYTCSVQTIFEATAENVLSISLVPGVQNLDLRDRQEGRLLNKVENALDAVSGGQLSSAVRSLNSFIRQVDGLSRRQIPADQAAELVDIAQQSIELIEAAESGLVGDSIQGSPKPARGR